MRLKGSLWAGIAGLLALTSWVGAAPVYQWEEGIEEPEYTWAGQVQGPIPWPAGAVLRLAFDAANENDHLALKVTWQRAALLRVRGGREQVLAEGRWIPLAGGNSVPVVLKRRAWRLSAVIAGEVAVVAYTAERPGPRLGVAVSPPLQWAETQCQPVVPLYFSDDFMRAPGEGGAWTVLQGNWRNQGVQSQKFDPRKSANPFVFRAQGPEPALATAGYWFWDSYQFRAAVKPEGNGTVGLAAYVQDAANYLLFRWTGEGKGQGRRQLVCVRNGRERVLAEAGGGFVPHQWYELGLDVTDGRARAWIDGQLALEAETFSFGQGPVGLFAANCPRVRFDDVTVRRWDTFADDFDPPAAAWTAATGNWEFTAQALHGRATRTSAAALMFTCPTEWTAFTWEAEAEPQGAAGVGLCFGVQDANNYYLFRWGGKQAAGFAQKLQVVKVENGKPRVLAEQLAPLPSNQPVRLRVSVQEGVVAATASGGKAVPPLQAAAPDFAPGRLGLCAYGTRPVAFRRVAAWQHDEEPRLPKLTEQFTKEETMEGWASARGAWYNPAPGTYWHKGDFFGSRLLRMNVPASFKGRVTLVISAPEPNVNDGYRLIVRPGPQGIWGELSRQTKVVATGSLPLPEGAPQMEIALEQHGSLVLVRVAERIVFHWSDPAPLRGRKVGFRADGVTIDLNQVQAWCDHLQDDTFANAPTEWYVQRGIWETTERWTCSPEWSFFGGWEEGVPPPYRAPILWSKRRFAGDVTVEAYVSIRMHNEGYNWPGDLNLTMCGDGRNLGRGYSLVIAGWGNKTTRLFRNGQPIAETDRYHLYQRQGNKDPNYTPLFHRHWWYLRFAKEGKRLRVWVDDELILEAEDPQPLSEGQVALWTLHKGILVARARVWYEQEAGWQSLPAPWRPPALRGEARPVPVVWSATHPARWNDFEYTLGEWRAVNPAEVAVTLDESTAAEGKRCLKIENLRPGGDFATFAVSTPFETAHFARLSFDYCLQPGVHLNFFLTAQGREYAIQFTGPEPGGKVTLLGRIEGVQADGRWHHAQFPLAEALQRATGAENVRVENLRLANPNPDPYVQLGLFTGNRAGDVLRVDNFRLDRPGGPTAEFQWAAAPPLKALRKVQYALDRKPDTFPLQGPAQTAEAVVFEGLEPGTYYFHLRAQGPEGRWLPPVHYPMVVQADVPGGAELLARGFVGGGLVGEYFNDPPHPTYQLNQPPPGPFFTQRVLTRRDATINFHYTADRVPCPGLNSEYWTARWTGRFTVPQEGEYTFYLADLDDGGRIYVDGQLVLDAWRIQPPAEHASKPVRLPAGEHTIKVEYYQGPGPGGAVRLLWSGPGQEKALFTFPQGLQAEYYNDPDQVFDWSQLNQPPTGPTFTQLVERRTERAVEVNLTAPPLEGLQPEYWSARWKGKLLVPRPENYTFYFDDLDDAARLYIDGRLVLDAWRVQSFVSVASEPLPLTAGEHEIVVEYHQAAGPLASLRLSWSSPSLPKEIIPPCFTPIRVAKG
ncbi:MAG TPA: hypothetical protein EYP85_15675 [Armatimonadetes bacterium]|nr:hypothetical protein [Armatimonadota bacterium]